MTMAINGLIDAIRCEIGNPSVRCDPYRRFLIVMAERTVEEGHHRLVTTNWDYPAPLDHTSPSLLAATSSATTRG